MDDIQQLLAARAAQGAGNGPAASGAPVAPSPAGDDIARLLAARAQGQSLPAGVAATGASTSRGPDGVLQVTTGAPGAIPKTAQQAASEQAAFAGGNTPAPTPPQRSWGAEAGRQLGLTARDLIGGVTGLADLPNVAINAGISGFNSLAGTHTQPLRLPSEIIGNLGDRIGLPRPETTQEKYVNAAATNMAGLLTPMGAGKLMSQASTPVMRAIGTLLQQAPTLQTMGAAGGGAAAEWAHEQGLNPWWQMGAGLAGGVGAAGAGAVAGRMGGAIANAARSAIPAVDSAAEALAPGTSRNVSMPPEQIAARAAQGVDSMVPQSSPEVIRPAAPGPMPEVPPALPPAGGMAPGAGGAPAPSAAGMSPGDALHQRVAQLLMDNPGANPAAAARLADFRNLGIDPTLGQITRDPMQYAQERNLRGVVGVGEPLTDRFAQQNTQMQNQLADLAGQPQTAYDAGTRVISALNKIDADLQTGVKVAYDKARGSTEARLDVPMEGIAQDYANVLHDYGDKVPSGVRNNFNQYGLVSGTQNRIFDMHDADNLLKVINANYSSDPATNSALRALRTSVKNAILQADDNTGQFAQARSLAAERFNLHDLVPAIEAAGADKANPDTFIRQFVVNANTDNVRAMAELLRTRAPEAFQAARNQVGATLNQAAMGINAAGDATFRPDMFVKAMQQMGPAKLSAFFTPDEMAHFQTLGRVGAYINSVPTASAVNFSNTASAGGNLLNAATSLGSALGKRFPWLGSAVENMNNRNAVNRALAAALSGTSQIPVPTGMRAAIAEALARPPAAR